MKTTKSDRAAAWIFFVAFPLFASVVLWNVEGEWWYKPVSVALFLAGLKITQIVLFPASSGGYTSNGTPVNIGAPRYAESGSLIGYKWVVWDGKNVSSPAQGAIYNASPSGWVSADRKPTMENENGIYVVYDPGCSVISGYRLPGNILVEVRCKGAIVHHPYGARAEKFQIGQIIDYNNHPLIPGCGTKGCQP
jgi:hypothetical protein